MANDQYRIELTRSAEKDLRRLRPLTGRALDALAQPETDPHRGHSLAGSLRGVRSLEFSLPGGAYRAAYVVDGEARACIVFIVGLHEGFYQRAERARPEGGTRP